MSKRCTNSQAAQMLGCRHAGRALAVGCAVNLSIRCCWVNSRRTVAWQTVAMVRHRQVGHSHAPPVGCARCVVF